MNNMSSFDTWWARHVSTFFLLRCRLLRRKLTKIMSKEAWRSSPVTQNSFFNPKDFMKTIYLKFYQLWIRCTFFSLLMDISSKLSHHCQRFSDKNLLEYLVLQIYALCCFLIDISWKWSHHCQSWFASSFWILPLTLLGFAIIQPPAMIYMYMYSRHSARGIKCVYFVEVQLLSG